MRGSGGGLPNAGEVRLLWPHPAGFAAREQASARALYVRMMCDRGTVARVWAMMPSDVPRRRLGRLPRTAFAFGCAVCVDAL